MLDFDEEVLCVMSRLIDWLGTDLTLCIL